MMPKGGTLKREMHIRNRRRKYFDSTIYINEASSMKTEMGIDGNSYALMQTHVD